MTTPTNGYPPRLDDYRPARATHSGQGPRPGGPRRARSSGGMGLMSWIVIGVLGVVGLFAGAAAVLLLTLPKDFIRDQIVAEVGKRTGRELRIEGPATFQLYPSVGFALSNVSFAAPEGMGDKPLLRMDSLDVSVRLLPLFQRQVAIERLVLRRPVIELHVDAKGRRTWDMAGEQAWPKPAQLAQATGTVSDSGETLPALAARRALVAQLAAGGGDEHSPRIPQPAIEQLQFGDVRIEDGTVHYSDALSGQRHDAQAINMRLSLKSLTTPLDAEGDLVWRNERIGLKASLTSVKAVMEERPAKLAINLTSQPGEATFDGTILVRAAIDADGSVTTKSPSVRALAVWLGTELPAVPGFGPFELSGQLRAAGRSLSLSNAKFALDGATGSGQIAIDTASARPAIKGSLKLSELDLNKYIGGENSSAGRSTPAAPVASPANPAPSAAPAASGAQSIEDLLSQEPAAPAGPRVKGFTQREGWSEGQIDATALGLIDADLKLALGRITYQEIKVGQSQILVALKSAIMKTTFEDVQLYGGRVKGFATLDATQPKVVAIGTNLSGDGIAAEPLLKDAARMDWLAGTGKLTLAVSGQGQSQRQIVETLTGRADMAFTNGAIIGWNIPGMVRGVSQGKISGLSRTPSERTDFSELSATWTITNGLAENQDLKLLSPLLRISGAGSVMLPAREIDYTMRPKLVATLEGQGSAAASQGLEIPVRITGGWDKPKIAPDLGEVLKDPNKAMETVKELGRQFKGKSAGDIVKGLLGDKSSTDTSADPAAGAGTAPASDADKAKKLLDGLLGR